MVRKTTEKASDDLCISAISRLTPRHDIFEMNSN
jgi:hypothetical protein